MQADWQLVKIELERNGWIAYTFRHRQQHTAGDKSTGVYEVLRLQHPRPELQIATWHDLDEVTK